MQVDFSAIDDPETFNSVPEGTYVCRITEVRESLTKEGHPRWAIRLEVSEGELAGRTAAWDGITWSERALPRAKHVLSQLGFDVSGTVDLQPDDLKGLRARVTVLTEPWEDPLTGRRIVRNRVPFSGYEAIDPSSNGDAGDEVEPRGSADRRSSNGVQGTETPF